jgi:ADP-heptose:LPS heptosyltransferase
MKNILLIRLKSIGDVVLTLPAVNAVRENFPSAQITFLTSKENAMLLQGFRAVNEVITLDRAAMRSGNPLKTIPELFGLLRRLRAGRFDLAVDFQGYGETAWLAWMSGAAQRWGSVRHRIRRQAYTRMIPPDPKVHAAEWHLRMLEQCGLKTGAIRNEFVLPETSVTQARQWFAHQHLDAAQPTLYLQPFTSAAHKNWPFENFLALADYWRGRGVQVIVGSGPENQPRLDQARNLGLAVACGLPRLTDAGLIQLSTLVVGGDTGFMHLAVALGKRVVMLMNGCGAGCAVPFRHPDWGIAPPTGTPLATLPPGDVIQAVSTALATASPGK